VAFVARHCSVFASEWIDCFLVVESSCRLPSFVGVAMETIAGQLPAVFIRMAIEALGVQPEECARPVDLISKAREVLAYQISLMAIAALKPLVFSFEFVSCDIVVEIVDTLRPTYQAKIPTRMVAVTFEARLFFKIHNLVVVSAPVVHTGGDFLVTFETLIRAQPGAQFMTLEAILHAFEKRVRLGQFARRYLRRSVGGSCHDDCC
jgi:hypothetical protein